MLRSLMLPTLLLIVLFWAVTAMAATGRPLVSPQNADLSVATSVTSTGVITVTTTDDELNSDGDCSLREAIQAAYLDSAEDNCPAGNGSDTIFIPAGLYQLKLGQLEITGSVTLQGSITGTSSLDANHQSRVLHIFSNATVLLLYLDIRNGQSPVSTDELFERVGVGGGIANYGTTFIAHSTIHDNHAGLGHYDGANDAVEGADGGGIYNGGVLTITNSTISGNTAGDGKTGDYTHGGYTGCGADGEGGGIANDGILALENSTVANNFPGHRGGVLYDYCMPPLSGKVGGIYTHDSSNTSVRNSIIAANEAGDCGGELVSLGYNLFEKIDSCAVTSDVDSTDRYWGAHLGPLADNGGATLTHALTQESLAIDAGNCTDSRGITVTVDQRGEPRPQGDGCDIGAYESPFTTTFVPRQTSLPFISFKRNPCIVSLRACNLTQNAVQDDVAPSWSPDGSQIAFVRHKAGNFNTGAIFTMNGDGSQPKLITIPDDPEHPRWSPDGSKIAFVNVVNGSDTVDIHVMNADGSQQTNLTNHVNATMARNPVWSPDSSKILYECSGVITCTSDVWPVRTVDLYVMNVDGSQKRVVATHARTGASPWSPDGSKIVYADLTALSEAAAIHIVDSNGSNPITITVPGQKLGFPAWSPDGKSIAYDCRDLAAPADSGSDICVMRSDGTQSTNLTHNAIPESAPIWSPDGSKLLFQGSYVPQALSPDIVVMNADGSQLTRLTFTPITNFTFDAAWAPDSHKIAYASNVTGDFEIYVREIEP